MTKIYLSLVAAMMAISANAQQFSANGLNFSVLEGTQNVAVTGYDKATLTGETLAIPASCEYEGVTYAVTEVGDNAFKLSSFTTVTIPESVTRLGKYAFSYMMLSLKKVTMGANVQVVDEWCFYRDFRMTQCDLPASLTTIAANGFNECSSLTKLCLPEGVTVGQDAFKDCSAITSVRFEGEPSAVATGSMPFPSLNTLIIKCPTPPAFSYCDVFQNTNPYSDPKPESVTLMVPEGAIAAYEDNDGWDMFKDYKEINDDFVTDFEINGLSFTVLGNGGVSLTGMTGDATELIIPAEVTYGGKTYAVTTIEAHAFDSNSTLTSVTIPSSVKTIGEYAFYRCTALSEAAFAEGLTLIQGFAFASTALTSVTIPAGTAVNDCAFLGCYNVEDCTILGNPGALEGGSMMFANLRTLTLYSPSVPADMIPQLVWGVGSHQPVSITGATLFVPENAVDAYKAEPQWSLFKNVLPIGTDPATAPAYAPEHEATTIEEAMTKAGAVAFAPATGTLQYLGKYYKSNDFFWDGTRGIVMAGCSDMKDAGIAQGQYLDGYWMGMADADNYDFDASMSQFSAGEISADLRPLTVSGQVIEDACNSGDWRYVYSYVELQGTINDNVFTTDDGVEFSIVNKNLRSKYTDLNGTGILRGVYMGTANFKIAIDGYDQLLMPIADSFFFDATTGIHRPESHNINYGYHDLMGRKVEHPTKGVFVNGQGKKIIF